MTVLDATKDMIGVYPCPTTSRCQGGAGDGASIVKESVPCPQMSSVYVNNPMIICTVARVP